MFENTVYLNRVKCAWGDSMKLVVKYFWPSGSLHQASSEKSVKLKKLWEALSKKKKKKKKKKAEKNAGISTIWHLP